MTAQSWGQRKALMCRAVLLHSLNTAYLVKKDVFSSEIQYLKKEEIKSPSCELTKQSWLFKPIIEQIKEKPF